MSVSEDEASFLDCSNQKFEDTSTMNKFAFVFIFALFALETTKAASVKIDHSDLLRENSDVKNLSDDMDELVEKHNIQALIEELKEDTNKLLKTSEKVERLCGPKTHELVQMLTETSQTEVKQCVIFALLSVQPLKELDQCLTRVEDRTTAKGRGIVDGLNQCIKNSEMLY